MYIFFVLYTPYSKETKKEELLSIYPAILHTFCAPDFVDCVRSFNSFQCMAYESIYTSCAHACIDTKPYIESKDMRTHKMKTQVKWCNTVAIQEYSVVGHGKENSESMSKSQKNLNGNRILSKDRSCNSYCLLVFSDYILDNLMAEVLTYEVCKPIQGNVDSHTYVSI